MKDNNRAEVFLDLGNQSFSLGELKIALLEFNRSLCCALPGSMQMAVAFANRAKIYFELNQFGKCLENLNLARRNGHPNSFALNLFQKMCFVHKAKFSAEKNINQENDLKSFIKLSYPANEKIPFIANCVELREDSKFGRHIIANRDLNPGDVVAIEELLFGVVGENARYMRCAFCLKSNMLNLIPCDQECTSAMFCDRKCLTEAKKAFHNIDCAVLDELKLLPYHSEMHRTLTECLAIHSGNRSKTRFDHEPVTIFDLDFTRKSPAEVNGLKMRCVVSLQPSTDSARSLQFKELSQLLIECYTFFNKSNNTSEENTKLISSLTRLMQIRTNNSCILHNNEGSGISLFGSLLNHSCVPNVSVIYDDNKVAFVVIKPIKKDEQLFLTYILPYIFNRDRKLRKEKLSEAFSFTCSCAACSGSKALKSQAKLRPTSMKNIKEAKELFTRSCEFIMENYKSFSSSQKCLQAEYDLHCAMFALSSFITWPVAVTDFKLNNNVL